MITSILAAISGDNVVKSLIWVVVGGIIFWLLWWLINYIKLPEPFMKVAQVILALSGVLFLINIILNLVGHPIFTM